MAPEAAVSKEPKKERMPRADQAKLLRGTFAWDVFTCAWCGGRRRVLAYLTAPNAVRAILQHLSLPTRPAAAGCSAGATPARGVLSLEPSRCQRRPRPCCLPLGATWARVCPMRLHRFSTGPAHCPRGSRPLPSSSPRLLRSPSTRPPSPLYAESGFHAGWGKSLEQLVDLALKIRVV